MSEPTRYRVANNQAQLTLGGGILAVDPAGPLVEYADYADLRMERIHDLNQIGGLQEDYARLKAEVESFKEYLKWNGDEHKFSAWEVWRRQRSDGGHLTNLKSGADYLKAEEGKQS